MLAGCGWRLSSVLQHTTPSDPPCHAVCGPSGVGKSTLISALRERFPGEFGFSVSHTTRKQRPGETHGVDYYFVDKDAMEAEIARGKFMEVARVHNNIYGTSFAAVEAVTSKNQICILDIDVQGVRSLRDLRYPAKYVFVAPPSVDTLEARLRKRGTEKEDVIALRVKNAVTEIADSKRMAWDAYIVNDDVALAFEHLVAVTEDVRAQCAAARAETGSSAPQ